MNVVDQEGVLRGWRSRLLTVDPPERVWSDFVHGEDELLVVVEENATGRPDRVR